MCGGGHATELGTLLVPAGGHVFMLVTGEENDSGQLLCSLAFPELSPLIFTVLGLKVAGCKNSQNLAPLVFKANIIRIHLPHMGSLV